MALSSQDYVYKKFQEFYSAPSSNIPPPSSLSQRELAFFMFKGRIMKRHKAFGNSTVFHRFLSESVPSDVYYSCAYYENPECNEMNKKGWTGADLVFDIDADHIPTTCNKIHDEWTCGGCNFTGKGFTPEECPICGGKKFDTKTWPCELCLNSAKEETIKLINMLEHDFGFSDEEIHVFFSGHRGYHVQIETSAVKDLDAMSRKEIVDYVSGLGLDLLENEQKNKQKKGFALTDYGWGKRLKEGMKTFILKASKDDLRNLGIKINSEAILKNKDLIVKRCLGENRWDAVKGVSIETYTKIADYVRNCESAKIDTVVTTDIHRLIRANETLHGKTGLRKVEFPVSDISDFDPFTKAVAFKEGSAKVFISDAPEFELDGKLFGPYRQQEVELPTAAAVLLICKDRAKVVTPNVQ